MANNAVMAMEIFADAIARCHYAPGASFAFEETTQNCHAII